MYFLFSEGMSVDICARQIFVRYKVIGQVTQIWSHATQTENVNFMETKKKYETVRVP